MYQKPSITLLAHESLMLNSNSTGSPIIPPSNTITLPKDKGPQNGISGA